MSVQNSHQVSDVKVMLVKGLDGSSIGTITKTSTSGLTDTYTITLTDGSETEFEVTNGNGIVSIVKTSTSGNIDTYTITFTDGDTFDFTVANGADEASRVAFDPTGTALPDTITNVQDALVELAKLIPSVTITLTLSGAKEDTIVITDSDGNTVGAVVFEADETTGTFTTSVASDYSDTWTFTSSLTYYVATATVDSTTSQSVKCMPEDVAYWYGNEVEALEVGSFTDSSATAQPVTASITKNTNDILIELPNSGSKSYVLGGIKTTNVIDYTGKTAIKVKVRLEYLTSTPAGYNRFTLYGSANGVTEISSVQPAYMYVLLQAIQSEYNNPGTASGEVTIPLSGVQNNRINLATEVERYCQYNKCWIDAIYVV